MGVVLFLANRNAEARAAFEAALAIEVADPDAVRREIREEAGHSLMFLELFQRSGVRIPREAHPRSGFATAAAANSHENP